MNDKDTTNSYLQISTETFGFFIEALTSANQRSLEYAKSVWEIASRPYGSSGVEGAVRENVNRSNEIMSLTVNELQARQQKLAEFAEKLVEQNANYALDLASRGYVLETGQVALSDDSAQLRADPDVQKAYLGT